jgi:hypothetical protein
MRSKFIRSDLYRQYLYCSKFIKLKIYTVKFYTVTKASSLRFRHPILLLGPNYFLGIFSKYPVLFVFIERNMHSFCWGKWKFIAKNSKVAGRTSQYKMTTGTYHHRQRIFFLSLTYNLFYHTPDPDPHSSKILDPDLYPDPHTINADSKHCLY